ncbi:sulfatase-like hydrolase/transferase [Chitinophaga sp.]|uniref:sulfatase family protein n=1 Tax=Chitinophaga sp. TaxID=1869181 RepID=UPI0031D0F986
MKKFFYSFLLLAVFLPAARAQQPKPNVVIIFIDDMGYGDLGCYGNTQAQTKNIDALARQGTRFTQFYVNSPVCSPSRVAMMTGQYPARHQFYTYLADRKKNAENGMPDFLPATVPTLAKMMRANGYATAHIGKWHLGGGRDVGDAPLPSEYGFDKSFTSFEGLGDRTLTMADNLNRQSAALGRGHITEAPQHQQTEMYVDSALVFVKGIGDRPFLLNFFPNDVHDPYNPVEGAEKEFAALTDNVHQQKFLATLKELDKQIGRLLAGLDKMGKLQNTLILLTSDNGPTDWPHYYKNGGLPPCSAGDLHGRKWSLYEGGIRVPFIAVWPGNIPAGKVNDRAVMSVVDIVPTVAALTGAATPAGYRSDGDNESRILLGGKQKAGRDIYWYYTNKPVPGKAENISPVLAIRSGKWKLLMNPDGSDMQLFNLEEDHRETKDVAAEEKKKAKALRARLEKWYAEVVQKSAKQPSKRI